MIPSMKFILASRSPERAKILNEVGIHFEVFSADIDESPIQGESVGHMVLRLALAKAAKIAALNDGTVIAADTLIECEGQPLGQPETMDKAKSMFNRYRSHAVKVWTASVWRSKKGEVQSDLSLAKLVFKELSDEEWNTFFKLDLWKRRAGGFSIHHIPCPLEIVEGDFDVVRGINSTWIKTCYERELAKLS